jgi:hypothetical protein
MLQLIEYANASGRIPFLDKNLQQVFKLIIIFNIEYELTRLRDILFGCIIEFGMDLDNMKKLYEITPITPIDTVFDIEMVNDKLRFYIDNFHEFTILPTNDNTLVIGSNVVSFNPNYKHGIVLAPRGSMLFNNNGQIGNGQIGNGKNGIVYKEMLTFFSNNQVELLPPRLASLPSDIYYEYAKKSTTDTQNDKILLDKNININHPFIIKCFLKNVSDYYYFELGYDPSKTDYFKFEKISKFLIAQLVLALHYLETKKISHYDLHLYQLLIGRDGFLRLCDFGSSKTKHTDNKDALNFSDLIIIPLIEKWGVQSGRDYDDFYSIIVQEQRSPVGSYIRLCEMHPEVKPLIDYAAFEDIKNKYYLIDTFKKKYPDLDIEIFFDIFGINYQFSQLINHPYLCDESDWAFLLEKERLYYT